MGSRGHDWLRDHEAQSRDNETTMGRRFRGYLPVVVDVETGGFCSKTDALLEIAITLLEMENGGKLGCGPTICHAVHPFAGANIEASSLEFTGIDPHDPNRGALSEDEALRSLFGSVRRAIRDAGCKRAILVGHNSFFDHGFLFAAAERQQLKRNPFHPFSTFDTVTLAGMAYGQTVLAKACHMAGVDFAADKAHNAAYDCRKTAELFCVILNRWREGCGVASEAS